LKSLPSKEPFDAHIFLIFVSQTLFPVYNCNLVLEYCICVILVRSNFLEFF
jgi:hypothetical protein